VVTAGLIWQPSGNLKLSKARKIQERSMDITVEDQQRGELSPQSLELACQRLSEVGFVIFEQVFAL